MFKTAGHTPTALVPTAPDPPALNLGGDSTARTTYISKSTLVSPHAVRQYAPN